MSEPLRTCQDCGLEAHNDQELELFGKDLRMNHGRENLCIECKNVRERTYQEENRERFRKRKRQYKENYRIKFKTSIFEKLGNKCVGCGFDDARAFQIDHINSGGQKERKELNHHNSLKYYRMLDLMPVDELKEKYQLLCCNCNWIKRMERRKLAKKETKV